MKIRLLDLGVVALLALLALLSWQMRREWVWAHARERALLEARLKPAVVQPLAPLSNVDPLAATGYVTVADNNLFSKDRNATVIIDPPAPPPEKPVPAFPVVHGVMLWPNGTPTVVLSENSGAGQKGYRPGDVIGPWKITSVDDKFLGLEWDGKQFKKRLDELFDKSSVVAEVPQAPARAAAPNAPNAPVANTTNLAGNTKYGADTGRGDRACVVGDTSPAGTVVDGYKKVITTGLMGPSCHWEK